MCVKLIKAKQEIPYDMGVPLEDQIKGCSKVIVDFRPNDPQLEKFMDEIERFAETGLSFKFNVQVIHNAQILGAKIKKQVKKVQKDLSVNELIKLMALAFDNSDRKLSEISEMCMGKVCVK